MRRANGYAVITTPEPTQVNFDRLRCEAIAAGSYEIDTIQCGHCGRIMHIKPRQSIDELGGVCRQCMKYECPDCVGKGCSPLEKKLELMEKRSAALRSYGF